MSLQQEVSIQNVTLLKMKHVSSNQLDAPGSGNEASSMARMATTTTQLNLICEVCNSGGACMLLLPCLHLCVGKPCVVYLMACPICGAMKGDAVETRVI